MNLAWISLAALLLVILVSCTATVNAGFLSIALAWVIGVYVAGWFGEPLTISQLAAGFPADLFLTLVGVTLLFSLAHSNGALSRVARLALRGCRGNVGLMPPMFFVLAFVLASIGAGNTAATALMAPLAMPVAQRAGISGFLMSIMVTHGAMAGGLSPITPTGIIAGKLMRERLQLSGFEMDLFLYNSLSNVLVAGGGYLLFGGARLFARFQSELDAGSDSPNAAESRMQIPHWETLAVIAALIVGVVVFRAHVGMGAFAGAVVLILLRAANERQAMQIIPWGVILMVSGVTVLTSLLEKTGGLDRLAELIGRITSPDSATAVMALLAGGISVYSSTAGVVLPAFLPLVPKLISQLGGGDLFGIACSVVIGGHLVDSSPLSTIGALCIASAGESEDKQKLFSQMLLWGLFMAVAGAVFCYVVFGLSAGQLPTRSPAGRG